MADPRSLAFYVRVSTVSQDFPTQLHALREFCRRHGWAVPAKARIYREKISGKLARRTQLDRLLTACRNGEVDTIIVYDLGRLGNSMAHLVNIQAELDLLKIRVLGVIDGLDTAENNAATNAYRNILNTMATHRRERISEATRDGLRAARAAGRVGGRPRTKDKQIARVVPLHRRGFTNRQIGVKVELSREYVRKILKAAGIVSKSKPGPKGIGKAKGERRKAER